MRREIYHRVVARKRAADRAGIEQVELYCGRAISSYLRSARGRSGDSGHGVARIPQERNQSAPYDAGCARDQDVH